MKCILKEDEGKKKTQEALASLLQYQQQKCLCHEIRHCLSKTTDINQKQNMN